VLVDEYPAGVEWINRVGATATLMASNAARLVYWMKPNPPEFVKHMVERFVAGGGTLLANAQLAQVMTDQTGGVTGVVARTPTGMHTVAADAVILTTGGWQANPEMRARYFGQWADRLILRGNPYSTGDGFQVAQAAGAAPSKAMASFYGHLLPAPPAVVPTNDFIAYTMYHSEQSVLVNLRGERFTDESWGDETNAQFVARQPEALGFLIYDDRVYRQYAIRRNVTGGRNSDTFYESKALGAPSATADNIRDLAEAMQEWGVYGPGVIATLEEFNRAVEANTAASLRIPRTAKANAVVTPPLYALAVTPGITFTLGGLRINTDAQVLDTAGRSIAGLYAAGADAGGIHNEQYAGGLCLGLVFGRRAARHAVAAGHGKVS
jgi:succinate dehydrogenase/fumarate reductase flavoprotein subunit